MRQIFMDIFDIIPTEGTWVKPATREESVDKEGYSLTPDGPGIFHYTGWLEDIREKGALYAIKVHPDGHIADGNFRYWCYRQLYNETKDDKWRFIPIDADFFYGTYRYKKNICTIRYSKLLDAPKETNKRKIIPSETELKEYKEEDLGHGQHAFCTIKDLVIVDLGLPILPEKEN